jgi:D-serine deaminase-like pyridoxal phosphate-dependent protein
MRHAIALKKEFGLDLYIHHAMSTYLLVDELLEAEIPISFGPILPTLGREDPRLLGPIRLAERGGVVAFHQDHPNGHQYFLRHSASLFVRKGMSEQDALAGLTLNPAKLFHLDDRIGISTPFHLNVLATVAARRKQALRVMLDLDAGMHRTGIGFGPDAAKLYREIDADPFLQPSGFHLYDGHDNFSDVVEREAAAQRNIALLQEFQQQIESAGMPVPCVVAGGSFSFPYYARTEGMYGSPGTFIYWDAGFTTAMPDIPFRCAALILTQVVDRHPDVGTITTDLGCKGISSDLPLEERAFLLGLDAAELVAQSEEHGVFRIPGELPRVGDYLLAVPGHICPTTIRYPGIHVMDKAGEVVDYYLHTARDRL